VGLGCGGTARGSDLPPAATEASEPSAQRRPLPAVSAGPPGFMGKPEAVLLDKLLHGAPKHIERGRGGRSLGFKLTMADGTQGYYKPEQSFSGANWYAEVVAHYLDRALGLLRVPPVVARRLPWSTLRPAAGEDPRVKEVHVGDDGTVRGALIAWLPGELERARTPPGWENWVRTAPLSRWNVTPYQRPSGYSAALRDRKRRMARGQPGVAFYEDTPEPDTPTRAAELSDLLVFDFLTLNIDRWGGDNGNVLTLGAGGPLIFLDNGAGFSPGPARRGLMDARLQPCERFRRRTVEALRRLSIASLGRRMARDALAPLLDRDMLDGIEVRREAILDQVAALERVHGDRVYFEE